MTKVNSDVHTGAFDTFDSKDAQSPKLLLQQFVTVHLVDCSLMWTTKTGKTGWIIKIKNETQ